MTAEAVPPPKGSLEEFGQVAEILRVLAGKTPAELHDLAKVSPEFQEALTRLTVDPAPRLRLIGKARKISVSMPEDLATAVQQRVGRGEFSWYVTEAVSRQLELDLLQELLAMLDEEYGPIPDEALTEARDAWPDAQ